MTTPLLDVQQLKVHYPIRKGFMVERQVGAVRAVDGVDLSIPQGRTLGLVGESGCGKSTVGKAILQLVPVTEGRVLFRGQDVAALQGEELRKARQHFQMVFQDPFSSLD